MIFSLLFDMAMETLKIIEDYNHDFYANCRAYFDAMQEQGRSDDSFEDEYYFTMPAISGAA